MRLSRSAPTPQLRIGVIDFIQLHLPFLPALAQQLLGRAQFCFFQFAAHVHGLLPQHRTRLWIAESTAARPIDWPDGDLLAACGRHERLLARSIPELLRQARLLAGRIETFLDEGGIDAVMVWNGAPLAAALGSALAKRRGLPVLYCENGYLPGTMQIDGAGCNYESSYTPLIAAGAYRGFGADATALDDCLDRLRRGRTPAGAVPAQKPRVPLPQRLRREAFRILRPGGWRWLAGIGRGRFARSLPADDRPFVLLPLQVLRDSQLNLHSPVVQADLARLVVEVYAAMRRSLPEHRLVVKLHPREPQHRNRAHLQLARKLPDVVFLQGMPMNAVLAACAMVVTINSTVGVEAMAFGKPVVTLGRNFYTVPELVHRVVSIDMLDAALDDAAARPHPPQRIRAFLGYLQQRVLVRGSHLDLSERSLAAIAERVLHLARAN